MRLPRCVGVVIAICDGAGIFALRHQPARGGDGGGDGARRISIRDRCTAIHTDQSANGRGTRHRACGINVGEAARTEVQAYEPADMKIGSAGSDDCAGSVGAGDRARIVSHQSTDVGTAVAMNIAGGIRIEDRARIGARQCADSRIAGDRSTDQTDVADRAGRGAEQADITAGAGIDVEIRNRVAQAFKDARERIGLAANGRPAYARAIERARKSIVIRERAVDVLHIAHAVEQRVRRIVDAQACARAGAAGEGEARAVSKTVIAAGDAVGVVVGLEHDAAAARDRDIGVDGNAAIRVERERGP